MVRALVIFLLVSSSGLAAPAALRALDGALTPTALRVEYARDPLGIGAARPRLSWRSEASVRGAHQTAYRIQAATTVSDLTAERVIWDSGQVASSQSLFVPYGGPRPGSRERIHWRVRVWDGEGEPSVWSDPAFWEMGLLEPEDWTARWIRPAEHVPEPSQVSDAAPTGPSEGRPAAQLRGAFELRGPVARARIYATARGLYALELNGRAVGDQVLTPGWTSYRHRIAYQTYDVTDRLREGLNVVGAFLADGWFRGNLGWEGRRDLYGDRTALRVQLVVTHADGRETVFGTDSSWRSTTEGPLRRADLYDGETIDARRAMPGWSSPGFEAEGWAPVEEVDTDSVALVAPQGPPVRRIEELRPIAVSEAPDGETVVDFGQNMVGWVRLRVSGPAGTEVVLRHAEILDAEGNLYTDNLRTADQTDRFILRGGGEEVFEPRFTFHGFRYVGVRGLPGALAPDDLVAVVVHSDMARTGSWSSSDPLLNRLYQNIVWGQRGNFVDVPTDCPQRDERLGWTGDAQVFAPTAALGFDVSGFFAKWLRDLALDQAPDGRVPHVVPDILSREAFAGAAAGWADAATVVPWTVYQAYGDAGVLEAQYPSMKAWVDWVASQAPDGIWRTGFHFGDWLAPGFEDTFRPYRAHTGTDLVATAYFARSADLVARTATVLGREQEARAYRALFERIRSAFQEEFVAKSGRVLYETQTAYALAVAFDLLSEDARDGAAVRLADRVHERGNHLSTGFLGTPVLARVLSDHGQTATAYDLLTQKTYPSWLYPVTFGATTIWERWDAVRTDGSFQDPAMTSFNHYAYGAIGEWMVEVVAGLDSDPEAPGYRRLRIEPQPGGGLEHVEARLDTPYGPAATSWALDGARFRLDVVVPPNTTAVVRLPLAHAADVTESGTALRAAEGVTGVRAVGEDLAVDVGSGAYRFAYASPELALRVAEYVAIGPETKIGDLLGVAEARAVIEDLAPALLDDRLLRSQRQASLAEVPAEVLAPATRDRVLARLAEVDAAWRQRILAPERSGDARR